MGKAEQCRNGCLQSHAMVSSLVGSATKLIPPKRKTLHSQRVLVLADP